MFAHEERVRKNVKCVRTHHHHHLMCIQTSCDGIFRHTLRHRNDVILWKLEMNLSSWILSKSMSYSLLWNMNGMLSTGFREENKDCERGNDSQYTVVSCIGNMFSFLFSASSVINCDDIGKLENRINGKRFNHYFIVSSCLREFRFSVSSSSFVDSYFVHSYRL